MFSGVEEFVDLCVGESRSLQPSQSSVGGQDGLGLGAEVVLVDIFIGEFVVLVTQSQLGTRRAKLLYTELQA